MAPHRLADGATFADWVKKPPAKEGGELPILAGLAELRAVLNALPNPREELEAIVAEARAALADDLDARISAQLFAAGRELSAVERQTVERADSVLQQVEELRGEASSALGRVNEWVPPELDAFAERAAVDAAVGAAREDMAAQVAVVAREAAAVKEEIRKALDEFKTSVDRRFRGVMMSVPASSKTKVRKAGVEVGERRALNFVDGANVTLTVADNSSGDQVDVTIASSGGGSAHTIREDGTDLTARTGLNFTAGLSATDDSVGDETEVTIAAGGVTNAMLAGSIAQSKITDLTVDLAAKAADADVVHDTGAETIAGVKTFSSNPLIPDEVYGVGWNGVLEPPTKNALYDKIETLSAGGSFASHIVFGG